MRKEHKEPGGRYLKVPQGNATAAEVAPGRLGNQPRYTDGKQTLVREAMIDSRTRLRHALRDGSEQVTLFQFILLKAVLKLFYFFI